MLTGPDLLLAVQNLPFPAIAEEQELRKDFQKEVEKCWEIAQKLDALNPTLQGAFTGTPSERINRQLAAIGILTQPD